MRSDKLDTLFQHTVVKKAEFFDKIVELLKGAGWTGIASIPTDFTVLNSKGVNNDKDLYIQLKETDIYDKSQKTTNSPWFTARLIKKYTPKSGQSGVIARPDAPWYGMSCGYIDSNNQAVAPYIDIDLWYYVSANGIMYIAQPPQTMNIPPFFGMMYHPEVEYCQQSECRGLMMNGWGTPPQLCQVMDNASGDSQYAASLYYITLQTNPTQQNKYLMSEIYYGSPIEGYRGNLNGIYTLPNINVLNRDIITIGQDEYTVFVSTDIWGLPSPAIAVLTKKG